MVNLRGRETVENCHRSIVERKYFVMITFAHLQAITSKLAQDSAYRHFASRKYFKTQYSNPDKPSVHKGRNILGSATSKT